MNDLIERMVSRFLGWKLPKDFAPDAGINFTPGPTQQMPHGWPTGTNLLNDPQARQMIEHMLAGETADALESAAAKVPEGAALIDAKFLARDIHHALCDDGLAPLSPTDCNAMREVITRIILKARPAL